MANTVDQWLLSTTNELLPTTLSRLATQHPDLVYAEFPLAPQDPGRGYRKITYKRLASTVHAIAWWIEQNVGKPAKDDGSETLAYLGPSDMRYGALVMASVMVGYKVFVLF